MSHRRNWSPKETKRGMTPMATHLIRDRDSAEKKEGDKGIKMRIKSPTPDIKSSSCPSISLTSCHWPSSNCELYQALWGMERAWNGSLIERGYYFPLLFPNRPHNDLQMLRETELMGTTRKHLCLPKQKTKIPTSGNHLNPEAKVPLDDKGCLEKSMRKQFSSRLFSPKATGLLRGCRQNVSCTSRRPTMRDEKNIRNGRTCDESFLADRRQRVRWRYRD